MCIRDRVYAGTERRGQAAETAAQCQRQRKKLCEEDVYKRQEYHFPVLFVLLYFAAVVMVYHVVSVYQKKSLQQHSIIERIRTIG